MNEVAPRAHKLTGVFVAESLNVKDWTVHNLFEIFHATHEINRLDALILLIRIYLWFKREVKWTYPAICQ